MLGTDGLPLLAKGGRVEYVFFWGTSGNRMPASDRGAWDARCFDLVVAGNVAKFS